MGVKPDYIRMVVKLVDGGLKFLNTYNRALMYNPNPHYATHYERKKALEWASTVDGLSIKISVDVIAEISFCQVKQVRHGLEY